MRRKLAIPTIHRNGSSESQLLDAVTDASEALYQAMHKMEKTHPNGRDYYPQGPGAIRQAEREYQDRMKTIKAVREELVHLAEAIADGGHGVAEENTMGNLTDLMDGLRGGINEMTATTKIETVADMKRLIAAALSFTKGIKWKTANSISGPSPVASVPRSRAKTAYNNTVKALHAKLKQQGVKFKSYPSHGDLLEDESASTRIMCKAGSIHVYIEQDMDDDRKFDLSVSAGKQ
jgi:hypothetical protein